MRSNIQLEKDRLVSNILKHNYLDNVFENLIKISSYNEQSNNGYITPKLDISENTKKYFIDIEIPGIDPDDIELKIDNNILSIEGKIEHNIEKKEKNYYLQERTLGAFKRAIKLPANINSNTINAQCKNGLLKIEIDKKEDTKVQQIEIQKT